MNLERLIAILRTQTELTRVVGNGFVNPHSYRGDYAQLAFEPAVNVTVGSMLAAATSALNTEFQGYKGGTYRMDGTAWVYLAQRGYCGNELTEEMLAEMLAINPPILSSDVVPLWESASKDAGHARYFLTAEEAGLDAEMKSGILSAVLRHSAIRCDGRYYLLKQTEPVVLAELTGKAALVKSARAKLTKEEREALGV